MSRWLTNMVLLGTNKMSDMWYRTLTVYYAEMKQIVYLTHLKNGEQTGASSGSLHYTPLVQWIARDTTDVEMRVRILHGVPLYRQNCQYCSDLFFVLI